MTSICKVKTMFLSQHASTVPECYTHGVFSSKHDQMLNAEFLNEIRAFLDVFVQSREHLTMERRG